MTRLPWPRWNASRKRYTNVLDITCSSIVHVVYCVQIAESTPLVGEREDLSSLTKEYAEDDEIYQGKIKVSWRYCNHKHGFTNCSSMFFVFLQDLSSRYSQLRRTRGDGNCFFRAFAFGYMESLLHDRSDLPRWGHDSNSFNICRRPYFLTS